MKPLRHNDRHLSIQPTGHATGYTCTGRAKSEGMSESASTRSSAQDGVNMAAHALEKHFILFVDNPQAKVCSSIPLPLVLVVVE